jgi:hypothetical protein
MFLDRSIPHALSGLFVSRGLSLLARVGIMNPFGCAWALHPGGKGILTAFESAFSKLGIKGEGLEASREVLRTHGNMSSPTILFVLARVLTSTARENVFFAGFGPGLTVEMGRIHRVRNRAEEGAAAAAAAEGAAPAEGAGGAEEPTRPVSPASSMTATQDSPKAADASPPTSDGDGEAAGAPAAPAAPAAAAAAGSPRRRAPRRAE